ncbi:MAG: hypothetical protein HUJ29_00210, partial [Gammaproteobacteria bacterium]|nr:hypothetical protein [Gammaproteobacteria bacterium]
VGEYRPITELPELLEEKGSSISPIAIRFGSEASGLPSSVLQRCHLVSTVPLATTYPSLNLAQAVLLYAHELSQIRVGGPVTAAAPEGAPTTDSRPEDESRLRSSGEAGSYAALLRRLEALLEDRGNPALLGKLRERLAHIDGNDVALIHSILNALESRDRC